MRIIGLCGGSGSGKGIVSSLFLEYGIPSIDTDALYREMTSFNSDCMQALIGEFGERISRSGGSLDRAVMASIVFSDSAKLKRLNTITHRFILNKTREILTQYRDEGRLAAIVDAPVLFESGFDAECDEVICVVAEAEIRLKRIMSRDGIDMDAAKKRVMAQKPDEELIARSNYVITNNQDLCSLKEQVERIAKTILDNSKKGNI